MEVILMVNPATFGYSALIPIIVMIMPLIFICRQLAKDKGKNTVIYTILACIPLVNYYALIYLVGAPNSMVEEKLDRLLAIIENSKHPASS
jgi:hypothetical protein